MVFCFVQNFFFGQHNSQNIYFFFVAQIFFQNLTLGYMTKNLNQIIFFFHQNQNIFFNSKLNGRSLTDERSASPSLPRHNIYNKCMLAVLCNTFSDLFIGTICLFCLFVCFFIFNYYIRNHDSSDLDYQHDKMSYKQLLNVYLHYCNI